MCILSNNIETMEYLKYEKPINNKYWIPKDPLKVFFSLLLFSLLLIPNCIWASIKSLLTKKKDVRGQVILVRIMFFFLLIVLNGL